MSFWNRICSSLYFFCPVCTYFVRYMCDKINVIHIYIELLDYSDKRDDCSSVCVHDSDKLPTLRFYQQSLRLQGPLDRYSKLINSVYGLVFCFSRALSVMQPSTTYLSIVHTLPVRFVNERVHLFSFRLNPSIVKIYQIHFSAQVQKTVNTLLKKFTRLIHTLSTRVS